MVHLPAHPSRLGSHSPWGASGHPSATGICSEQPPCCRRTRQLLCCSISAPSPKLLTSGPWLGLGLQGCFPVQDAHLEPIRHL